MYNYEDRYSLENAHLIAHSLLKMFSLLTNIQGGLFIADKSIFLITFDS